MKNPKIKTTVVHSQTKAAWNVIGTTLGGKYKIARVPYLITDAQGVADSNRIQAFEHATFISYCLNNSDAICVNHNIDGRAEPELLSTIKI